MKKLVLIFALSIIIALMSLCVYAGEISIEIDSNKLETSNPLR